MKRQNPHRMWRDVWGKETDLLINIDPETYRIGTENNFGWDLQYLEKTGLQFENMITLEDRLKRGVPKIK